MAAKQFLGKQKYLVAAIKAKQCRDGLRGQDVAKELRIAYSHFAALMSGGREFAAMSPENIRVLAMWLGISAIQVRVWAGDISSADFLPPGGQEVGNFISELEADQEWGAFAPSATEWEATPKPCKFLMSLLYKTIKSTTKGGGYFDPSGGFSANLSV